MTGLDLLPMEVGRQIDLLCDAFEQPDAPRPIEEYLRQVATPLVAVLREELIRVELECRFRRGDTPRAEEYQTRFPECAGLLTEWLRQAEEAALSLSSLLPPEAGETVSLHAVSTGGAGDQVAECQTLGPAPRILGEYELLDRLGTGGMGEVYRARHRRLKKLVALKLIRQENHGSADALARFRREMEAVGQLDHPHVVEAHDAGEQDGVVYLVLKLIDGVDLYRLVQERGPLPAAEACELIRQAALGLQYLHERGLVHRDIKPSNLMRAPAGTVKVLDLGLSRLHSATAAGELTATNTVMGTLDFIAPEQIDNAAGVDGRADLYSMGATLFYLLTGQAPFAHRQKRLAKIKAHGEETPPDVRSLRPELPEGVAALVARLLAKRPEERLASAQELADALAALPTTTTGEPSPVAAAPVAKQETLWNSFEPSRMETRLARNRTKALIVAACLLLAVPVLLGMLARMNRNSRRLPYPAVPNTLKVLRLDVDHFAKDGNHDDPRGLLGQRSFTTHCDDGVTVSAELSAPAYCYLIAFRPDGTEELCFPENEDEPPPLTDRARYPSVTSGVLYGLNEGAGLHAFVLVASSKPLPAYAEWQRQRRASPWQKSEAQVGVVWRLLDGVTLRAHTAADPEARGKGQEVRALGGLPEVITWLRQAPGVEVVAAVAFAVVERK